LTAVPGSFFILVFAATFIFSMSYSGQWQAMWLIGLADLDSNKLLEAQGHILRLLYTLPAVLLFALKAHLLGAGWLVLLQDVIILAFEIEIMVTMLQGINTSMPFGAAFQNDNTMRRVLMGFMMLGAGLFMALINWSYASQWIPGYVTWLILPVVWFGSRMFLRRRCGLGRLNMDVVLEG